MIYLLTVLERSWTTLATVERTTKVLNPNKTTSEVTVTEEVKGKLLTSSKSTADYKSNSLITSLNATYLFETNTQVEIPHSTVMYIDNVKYITGLPKKYTYHQEIPILLADSLKEVQP